jgi:ubiquinone/menaquinone biosynthesis C-methylase UbiE
MLESSANMIVSNPTSDYSLGSTDAEHERLIRQAALFAPFTERLFREAGIGPGQRVLDIGSGVGDVAMLAARLVGPCGEVVGIERDPRSLDRARVRMAEAGLHNVSFRQTDVSEITDSRPFDAAVGRLILMHLPDPVSVLRSLSRLVRAGGVLAFQEPYWAPVLALLAPLPLCSAAAGLIHETFQQSGANMELGLALWRVFQEAGLPEPTMRLEMPLGNDPELAQACSDLILSLRPRIQQLNLSLEPLGNLDTLSERLQAEVAASNTVVAWLAPVGAWARKPSS